MRRFSRSPRRRSWWSRRNLGDAWHLKELDEEKEAPSRLSGRRREFDKTGLKPDAGGAGRGRRRRGRFLLAEDEFKQYDQITLPATTDTEEAQEGA